MFTSAFFATSRSSVARVGFLLGVPGARPPRRSPGFDPRGMRLLLLLLSCAAFSKGALRAFLRAELNITEAQASAWGAFADAMRANAKKLAEARASMMPQPGAGQQQAPTIAERLDQQERWLLARLEGTRALKSAVTNLYVTLSEDQKKTANELLAPQMGMGMMAMMPGQRPGQMMPPRQMQPGAR